MKPKAIVQHLLEDDLEDFDAKADAIEHAPEPTVLEQILDEFGTLDDAELSLEAAARRSGSPHEEEVVNDRPWCACCGYVDVGEPNWRWHPEPYIS